MILLGTFSGILLGIAVGTFDGSMCHFLKFGMPLRISIGTSLGISAGMIDGTRVRGYIIDNNMGDELLDMTGRMGTTMGMAQETS